MDKHLLTTSITPRKYYKECLEKGIKICSNCGETKELESFSNATAPNNKVYKNSHCKICVAKKRKNYVKKNRATKSFKTSKREDAAKGRNNLRASYIVDNLVTSLLNYSKRRGYKFDYAGIHKCITPEMLVAKEASIKIQRLIKTNHE